MGILNISPDSFFDGGRYRTVRQIALRIGRMVKEGADIIDIGANSSRPGSKPVSEREEWKRLEPVLKSVIPSHPETIFSIDTFYSGVAAGAHDYGVHIVNDISGGSMDKKMFGTVAERRIPYVLMHMKGKPAVMQKNPRYKNVALEVLEFLRKKIERLREAGVTDIIVDPGFGFGKSTAHNFQLLRELSSFRMLDCPVLAGMSRKSMICKTIHVNPVNALNGTTALNMLAMKNGASILRVHDVKEAAETVKLFLAYKNS